jgi:hypothetical protein
LTLILTVLSHETWREFPLSSQVPQGPEEPRTPRAGLLFDESKLSPKKGDCGAEVMSDRIALARAIAARTKPSFIEIPRERGGGKVPFTDEQLTEIRGGLTAEEYRWKLIKKS